MHKNNTAAKLWNGCRSLDMRNLCCDHVENGSVVDLGIKHQALLAMTHSYSLSVIRKSQASIFISVLDLPLQRQPLPEVVHICKVRANVPAARNGQNPTD